MKSREISRSKIGPFSLACTDPNIGIGWEYQSKIATVCPPSCFNKQSLQQNVRSILIDHINILNSENTV